MDVNLDDYFEPALVSISPGDLLDVAWGLVRTLPQLPAHCAPCAHQNEALQPPHATN